MSDQLSFKVLTCSDTVLTCFQLFLVSNLVHTVASYKGIFNDSFNRLLTFQNSNQVVVWELA